MPDALPPTVSKTSPENVQYFNGFELSFGTADFGISLKLDNATIATLKTSYTVGKTFGQKFSEVVAKFEKVTAHELMTIEDVHKAIIKAGVEKKT